MASTPLHSPPPTHLPHITKTPPHHTNTATVTTRRSTLLITLFTTTMSPLITTKPATALDLRMTVPDQTLEEAETSILPHARTLLNVKEFITSESWKELQKQLRKSSAFLKQDIYTIIQAKSPNERSSFRKLYSELFTAVTNMDYAARDKDRVRVMECYDTIVLALDDVLSRVQHD